MNYNIVFTPNRELGSVLSQGARNNRRNKIINQNVSVHEFVLYEYQRCRILHLLPIKLHSSKGLGNAIEHINLRRSVPCNTSDDD